MASNKNQHFVPRCYLRAFSCAGEGLAINLLNLDRQRLVHFAPVKHQCSGDYFYGKDDLLEEAIQYVERGYAATVARIHTPGYELTEPDKAVLRTFILFQHMRTEAASRSTVEMFEGMETAMGTAVPGLKPSIKESVQIAMKNFADQMHVFDDLKVCLIKNRTTRPFITSDDPAVVANRWHQQDSRVRHTGRGLMSCGAVAFLPLSPRVLCVAYDGDVYSIAHEKGWSDVRWDSDVAAFNEQQFLSAFANTYFQDWGDGDFVLQSYRRVEGGRLETRVHVNYAVLDKTEGEHKRYRIVERFDSEEHEQALIHTQRLFPIPSRWPTQLRWRPKGSVYTNGTGAGYIRALQTNSRSVGGYWKESSGH